MASPRKISTPQAARESRGWMRSWAGLLACGALLFLVIVFALAGPSWGLVLYRLIVDGLSALCWLLGATGLGWLVLHRVRLIPPGAPRLLRVTSAAALGLGLMSAALLGLSLCGALNRPSTFALMIVGLAAGISELFRNRQEWTRQRIARGLMSAAGWNWLWLIVTPMLAIATLASFTPPGILWGDEPNGYDVVEYHLQVPREWYEAGRMTPLHHNIYSYFPFNVEMHYLAAMYLGGGPWEGMYTAQLLHMAIIILAVLSLAGGASALARAAGDKDPGRSGAIAGVAGAVAPWMTLLAGVAYDDGGLLLFGALAIAWALVAMRSPEHRARRLLLAGAMAGFACGSKLTAVPIVLAGLVVALIVVAIFARRLGGIRRWIAPLGIFILAGLLTFSPWLIRNAIWAGNPVFPELPQLGHRPSTDVQVERWRRAHSPIPAERPLAARLRKAWQEIAVDWRYGYLLLPLGIAALVLSRRRAEAWMLAAMLGVLILFWLGFTHLQSRFFVLAIPLLAMLVGQVRWRHWPVLAALALGAQALVVTGPGLMHLEQQRIEPFANAGALGIENLSSFVSKDIEDAQKAGHRIRLVGDARAFFYQMPMSQLTYRTVFDVGAGAEGSPVDLWLKGDPLKAGDVEVINYDELRRFARTYWMIPAPPSSMRGIHIVAN